MELTAQLYHKALMHKWLKTYLEEEGHNQRKEKVAEFHQIAASYLIIRSINLKSQFSIRMSSHHRI